MRRPHAAAAVAAAAVAVLAACGDEGTTARTTAPAEQRYEVTTTVLESPEHGPELCLGGIAESLPPQCGGPAVAGWSWAAVDGEESVSGTTWVEAHLVGTFDGDRFTLTEPPGPPRPPPPEPRPDFSPACDDPTSTPGAAAGAPGDWPGLDPRGDLPGLVAVWVSDPAGPWDGPFTVSVVVRPGFAADAEAEIRQGWAGPLCVVERDLPTAAELWAVLEEAEGGEDTPLGIVYTAAPEDREGVVVLTVAVADEAAERYAAERWGDLVRLEGLLTPVG